jgi:hypothetical protein
MQARKLTKTIVDGLAPTNSDQFVWDNELAGFAVRVRPGGSKTFIAQYRAGGGRSGTTRRFTIGRYGTLTVDEARLQARKVLAAAVQGQDPSRERTLKRREMTIAELVGLYAAEGSGHLKKINRCQMPPAGWRSPFI